MQIVVRDAALVHPNGVEALASVTLALAAGEVGAVVGPSGCGKSTLLRLLAGLATPTRGEVLVDGAPPAVARPNVGVVFQQPTLLPWRTAVDNVALPLELAGVDAGTRRERAVATLAAVGLADGFAAARPRALSGGMRMRVALARALVTAPGLLLLDEPFGALDALTRETLQEELAALRVRRGFTAVLVTHDVAEAVFLADRVWVSSPRPGRIVAEVPTPFGRSRTAALRGDPAFARAVHDVRAALEAAA